MGYYRDDDKYCGYYLSEEEIAALPVKTFNPDTREEYLQLRAKNPLHRRHLSDYPPWMREQKEVKEVQPESNDKGDIETLKQRMTRLERAFTNSRSLPEHDKATQKPTRQRTQHTDIELKVNDGRDNTNSRGEN